MVGTFSEVVISSASMLTSVGADSAAANKICDLGEPQRQFEQKPFAPFDVEEQVPNRSDQRAMSLSMQAAAVAAGRALERAALKNDEARLSVMHLVVAGRCSERDLELDKEVIEAGREGGGEADVNLLLRDKLRPSLFLSQLPNLISANISIVHSVLGRSQTLLGDELAGLEAVLIARDRIRHGEIDLALVGAVFSAAGDALSEAAAADSRLNYPFGSSSAFLVLESGASAASRGHRPLAKLVAAESAGEDGVSSDAGWFFSSNGPEDDANRIFISAPFDVPPPSLTIGGRQAPPHIWVERRLGNLMEAAVPVALCAAILSRNSPGSDRIVGRGRDFGSFEIVLEAV